MTIDQYDELRRILEAHGEPSAPELWVTLAEVLGDGATNGRPISLERVKKKVYRVRVGADPGRSLVLKRHKDPGDAGRARLVSERWLPVLRLGACCPRVLGTAADRHGRWVWQLYEDCGVDTLLTRSDPTRLGAAVDLIAELHTRAAGHPVLCQVRAAASDYGVHHFEAAVRDAERALEALPASRLPGEAGRARDRLRRHLHRLRLDTGRVRVLTEAGERETMLHGDLLAKNVIVAERPQGWSVTLLDWDHVGVGPVSYDLSTFLTRFPAEEREWIVSRYRDAVRRLDGDIPDVADLNVLCDTAEQARCAEYVAAFASKLLLDGERLAPDGLFEVEGWFQALRPLLPQANGKRASR